MPLDITCHHCGKSFRIGDDVAGKHFRCVGCQTVLKAPDLSAPKPDTPPSRARKADPPQRQNDSRKREEKTRRHTSPPPRALSHPSKQRPKDVIEDYDNDEDNNDLFRSGVPQEASWDLPPRQKKTPKRHSAGPGSRSTNPAAFEEYDSICNEIAIFWIGLAVIVGGFAGLLYGMFMDGGGGANGRARQENIVYCMAAIAGASFVVGLITFSRSRIWLAMLFPICASFLVGTIVLAILGGCLIWILPVAFCVMFLRIQKAFAAYPR